MITALLTQGVFDSYQCFRPWLHDKYDGMFRPTVVTNKVSNWKVVGTQGWIQDFVLEEVQTYFSKMFGCFTCNHSKFPSAPGTVCMCHFIVMA